MSAAATLLAVAAFVAAAHGSTEIPSRVFPADSELIYNYAAHVSAGTTQPQDFLSHYSIHGKLRTQTVGEKVKFRLEDVLFSTYNGKGNRHKLPEGEYVSIPVPKEAKDISKPFVAVFNNGKIASFEYETGDTLWSRNLKRSIVSQFQVDLKEFSFELPRVFTSDEMSISGECKVENIITYGGKPESYSLRKSQDATRCKGPKYWHDNLCLTSCTPEEPSSPISSSTERNYDLHLEKDSVVIKKLKSRSVTSFQPMWIAGDLQYIFINQTFVKDTQGAIPVPLIVGETTPSSLTFEFQDSASGSGPDLAFERFNISVDQLVMQTEKSLIKSAEKLSESPEADASEIHETNSFQYLLTFMRHLDYAGLRRVADFALLGTSYKDESIKQIFATFLPKVGTQASVRLLRELIVKKEFTDKQAITALVDLPVNLRYPTANLLSDCKDFLTLGADFIPTVKHTAILTFSSMVGKICQTGACPPALLDEYAKLFFGRLRDAKEYGEQMLYIQALGNIKMSPVLTYLEPIIRGKLSYPSQLRFQAVWATADELLQNPDKVREIYWPILADRKNVLEMRVAALTMLINSQPSTENLMNLLWYMVSEPSYQLYQFFYTSISSLKNSKFPCYSKLSTAAQQISRMMPKIKQKPSALTTSNEIFDFVDPDLGIGEMVQLMVIGSEKSDTGDLMFFQTKRNFRGLVDTPLAVYIRTEGFNDIQPKKSAETNSGSSASAKLQEMFNSLKVERRTGDEIHVEIILQVQGRTAVSLFFDKNGIAGLVSAMQQLQSLQLSQHINYQSLVQTIFFESIFPSDLGTVITVQSSNLPMVSLRGNMTYGMKGTALTAGIDLDAKASMRQGYGVMTFNPLSALWNGVHRPSVHVLTAPVNFSLSYDFALKTFKAHVGWNKDRPLVNALSHGRSNTFVAGTPQLVNAVLPQTCPTCSQFARVTAGTEPMNKDIAKFNVLDTDMEVHAAIFDCEHNMDVATPFIKPFFIRRFSNYGLKDFDPWNLFSVAAMQTELLLYLDPLVHSCGRQFKITPRSDTTGVEFIIKSENGKGTKRLYRFLANYLKESGEVAKSWDTNIIAEPTEDETRLGVKVRIVRKQEGKLPYVSCLKMDNTYPERGPETYWDQLGQPFESRKTEHRLVMEFGENEESKCPVGKGGQIEVIATSEHQGLDDTVWPFNVCEQQRQQQNFKNEKGELLYPATSACAFSSWGPRPRNLTLSVSISNVPALDTVMSNQLGGVEVFKKKDGGFKMQIDTMHDQKESNMLMKVRSESGKEKEFKLPLLFNHAPYIISESLAHYPSIDNVRMGLDMIHPCLIAGGKIMTFDNASLPFRAPEKYVLVSGACIEDSPFALFARKAEGSSTVLAAKVFMDGSEIDIEPVSGQRSKVTLNGEPVTADVKLESFSIKQKEDGKVDVKHNSDDFYVRSTPINLAVLVPSKFDRYYCGLCGDSNRVPELQETLGPDNKMVSIDEMVAAYTMP